jgi:hypothetical protein
MRMYYDAHRLDRKMLHNDSKQSSRASWRLHKTHERLDALLDETGGEVTPEVEALEAEIMAHVEEAAKIGAAMVCAAKQRTEAIDAEIKRLQARKAYEARCVEAGKRLLRLVSDEIGETTFSAGTYRVSVRQPLLRVVGQIPEGADPAAYIERGLATAQPAKVDRRAIKRELQGGFEVAGFSLERGGEKGVVVR